MPVVVADSVPAVVLNADVLTGTAPLTVTVTDDSSAWDGIASRLWSLDGTPNPDTAITVEYTFDAPGTYTLALEVTDNDGSVSSDTVEITVTGVAEATVPMLPPVVALALAGLVSALGARASRRRI